MEDPCYKSEPYVVICADRKGELSINEGISMMISRDSYAGFTVLCVIMIKEEASF
jgi:hypothetical protein